MSLGAAHALTALLLEHADLGAARLAVDHTDHPGIGDERRAGEDLAAILLEQQHAVDADFLTRLGIHAINGDHGARRHLDLAPAALNHCEHSPPLRRRPHTRPARSRYRQSIKTTMGSRFESTGTRVRRVLGFGAF